MATEDISTGRFSSNALGQYGAKKEVRTKNGIVQNTYTSRRGNERNENPEGLLLSDKTLVKGSVSENTYTAILAYFTSRGLSSPNAATMALLVIDASKMLGISPMKVLDNTESTGIIPELYVRMNYLRSNGDQQQLVSSINNTNSLKSSLIKA